MIKVQAKENFTLKKFDELKNIIRYNPKNDKVGQLYENDIFECDDEMYNYLNGANLNGKSYVKIVGSKKKKSKKSDK